MFVGVSLLSSLVAAATSNANPAVVICSGAQPTEVETFAIQQLQEFGAPLQTSNASINVEAMPCATKGSNTTTILAVGPDASASFGFTVPAVIEGSDGYYVDSVAVPHVVAMTGGTTPDSRNRTGTVNAVVAFLEALGVEFVAPEETVLPAPTAAPFQSIPALNKAYRPAFENRDSNEWPAATHADWAARLGYNGATAHGPAGLNVAYASPPGFVHTSYNLMCPEGNWSIAGCAHNGSGPPLALFESHNEWFWPRDDASAYGQLCWTNTSLIEFVTQQVLGVLKLNPNARIVSVSQNDNGNYCNDTAEQAVIAAEQSPMGPLLRAVNSIAAAVEAAGYSSVAIDTLAYQYSRPAPVITKPRHNVIIRLCSIECNFAAPLTDPSNAAFQTDIVNWGRISNRTYIWNYITNFRMYMAPFPNYYTVGKNIPFFADHGVVGIFEEGSYGTSGGDMDRLKDYVAGKMLFDPTQDPDKLIAKFLAGYFGEAAAPFVRLYMDTMHGSIADTDYYMHESFDCTADFLSPVALLTSAQAFTEAAAAVVAAKAPARFGTRVETARMAVTYCTLLRWTELQTFANASALQWPFAATKLDEYNRFAKAYQAAGVTSVREGGSDLNWYHSQVFPS